MRERWSGGAHVARRDEARVGADGAVVGVEAEHDEDVEDGEDEDVERLLGGVHDVGDEHVVPHGPVARRAKGPHERDAEAAAPSDQRLHGLQPSPRACPHGHREICQK
jgi:hypothetical protein